MIDQPKLFDEDEAPVIAPATRLCPACLDPVPEAALYCVRCTQIQSYRAVRDQQKHWIGQIVRGHVAVRLRKPYEERSWHVGIANYPQAWCGHELKAGWAEKRVFLPQTDEPPICRWCRAALEKLHQETE